MPPPPQIMSDDYGDGKWCMPLRVTSPQLEKELWEWIQKVEAQGVCLSRELIKMKARYIQQTLCDAWELTISEGWLSALVNCFRHTGIVFNGMKEGNSETESTSYEADVAVEDIIVRASQLTL
ncbi:hypothetical protein AM588_10000685 [Phytophthora nicotianae]|uniref:HTH CENPB-type domain-containing protein n=1 Tax=Phytophthora nicotianae TaxID=4792 RepID=A0A0W8CKL0_PHYNI|nr:hypothetical protein AM588_10000685 [Phytophthora nicotianae]